MQRLFLTFSLLFSSIAVEAQQHSVSLGLYTGFTLPYTFDQGIDKDPRYKERYDLRFAPIGINYSMDFTGYGFLIGGGLIETGQHFYVVNTSGGQDGMRKIDLRYLNVPAAFKIHIIDLAFFKVSAVASVSGAFLLKGSETIQHTDTKLTFPEEVYPILPPDYIVEYDGVRVPNVDEYTMLKKEDFRTVQVFTGLGIRSDWDVSDKWRVVFDFRVNYGLFDPRSDAYLNRLKAHETLYDLPGKRRDMFAQFSVGIARYVEFDKADRDRNKNIKGSSRKYTPKKSSTQRRRPRG
jgi:hypothetical protein